MKYTSPLAVLAMVLGLVLPSLAEHGASLLIVPGTSIGKLSLGPNGAEVLKHFGRPDFTSVGMNQSTRAWVNKRNHDITLFIHTTNNGVLDNVKPVDGVTLDVIRTSSSAFHTANGIEVGSTLNLIRHRFPKARRDPNVRNAVVYSDSQRGIAFEFSKNGKTARCIGISVFPPGHEEIVTRETVSNLVNDKSAAIPERQR